jgi:hypothetical protein
LVLNKEESSLDNSKSLSQLKKEREKSEGKFFSVECKVCEVHKTKFLDGFILLSKNLNPCFI